MILKALTVSQLTGHIKNIIENDIILSRVMVRGEISNFKHHYSGHMYFSLKDDYSKIKCVMFKSACSSLKFYPEDGMSVIASGNVSLYERDGQYQLYVSDLQPDGKGALYLAFEQLKERLEKEGLFSSKNKVPIPKYPSRIAVVTSSTGAAVRDVLNIATRRYPGIYITVVPVLVQGSDAPKEIADAIGMLNKLGGIDTIIIGRGGGSIEELWAFNEECVARAIFESKIPIISAVGHETNFTIADFVSDLRAPTPSAAAELSVPDKYDMSYKLGLIMDSLINSMESIIEYDNSRIERNSSMLNALSPNSILNQKKQYIDSLSYKLISLIEHKMEILKEGFMKTSACLENLSPLSVISRGYSIALSVDSKETIDNVEKVKYGDNIDVMVKNGTFRCVVKEIQRGEKNVNDK